MDYVPVINVAQVELVYSWSGQNCQNVLHYLKPTAWDEVDLFSLAADIIAEWSAGPKLQMASTISLINVKCTDLTTQNGATVTYSGGLPLAGTLTAPSVPNNVAMVVTKRTSQRGRSFRGRLYHPGLANADVTANVILAARVSGVVAAWTTMLTVEADGETCNMVVVSRVSEGDARVTGIATIVNTLTGDNTIDSMRTRLPGRGN